MTPISFTEKDKKALITNVTSLMNEHLSRFPYAKYPIEPLEEWRRFFCDPKTVPVEMVKQALSWHFGGWQRKDLALAHRKVTAKILKTWPEFVESPLDPQQALTFWVDKLTDWYHGFGAVAFLLHLQLPNTFEIVDRHRIDAMNELLRTVSRTDQATDPPPSLSTIQNYTQFFRTIFPKLPYGDDSRVKLDRFLKVYGNRHAYNNVSADFKVKEPIIRTFSWESSISKRFCLDQIANRSNVDILFACLLLSLEGEEQDHNDLTIGEIIDRLPLGTGGLCNPASFNYALVALFGGQKQRDFWKFHNPTLLHAFTEQAKSTRNMRFYLTHADEKVSINPKYLNGRA